MGNDWQYQIRFRLPDELAEAVRDPSNPFFQPTAEILLKHDAVATTTFDAFANYVSTAEREGVDLFPLYKWTKETVEDPAKRRKHLASFAVYVAGEEVYDRATADAIEADLRPLLEKGVLVSLTKHDTDPANNPQAPAHLLQNGALGAR